MASSSTESELFMKQYFVCCLLAHLEGSLLCPLLQQGANVICLFWHWFGKAEMVHLVTILSCYNAVYWVGHTWECFQSSAHCSETGNAMNSICYPLNMWPLPTSDECYTVVHPSFVDTRESFPASYSMMHIRISYLINNLSILYINKYHGSELTVKKCSKFTELFSKHIHHFCCHGQFGNWLQHSWKLSQTLDYPNYISRSTVFCCCQAFFTRKHVG